MDPWTTKIQSLPWSSKNVITACQKQQSFGVTSPHKRQVLVQISRLFHQHWSELTDFEKDTAWQYITGFEDRTDWAKVAICEDRDEITVATPGIKSYIEKEVKNWQRLQAKEKQLNNGISYDINRMCM